MQAHGLLVGVCFALLATAIKTSYLRVLPLQRIGSSSVYKCGLVYQKVSFLPTAIEVKSQSMYIIGLLQYLIGIC